MLKLQSHLESLAKELGCVMEQGLNVAGMMYVEEEPPRIEGPIMVPDGFHPTMESSYFTMLHELGHVYHGHTQGRPPHQNKVFYFDNGVLKSEAQAWEYALDNAIIKPTEKEKHVMVNKCILSYYSSAKYSNPELKYVLHNGNRHHHEFKWDQADDYFWSIVERMNNGT